VDLNSPGVHREFKYRSGSNIQIAETLSHTKGRTRPQSVFGHSSAFDGLTRPGIHWV